MNIKKKLLTLSAALLSSAVLLFPVGASAATVVVTPANEQGWSRADTRPGGAVNFVVDFDAPRGTGALELTTNSTTSAKAQYLHGADTALSSVSELSYFTKQITPAGPVADPAYQVIAYLNGGTAGFSTLVYEPYQNPSQGPIVNNSWQKWDVDAGKFWSTRTVECSNGTIVGTPGGPATYTLAQIKAACPQAKVIGFGVNIGTNNPSYNVRTDAFNFNGTVYDFEARPQSKEDCKNGGFEKFNNPSFRNQGDCVSYVNRNKNNSSTTNNNNVNIRNNTDQNARSGNASSSGNNNSGSANSGNARNNSDTSNNVRINN